MARETTEVNAGPSGDLADRIAAKLENGTKATARQKLDLQDRLRLWVGGKAICDPETATVMASLPALKYWHLTEGLGRLTDDKAGDLWSDIVQQRESVDLTVWHIVGDWYYDSTTGTLSQGTML